MASQLRFEGFTLDLANRTLLRDGRAIELGSRYFDALVLLARNPGALVSKDRFMDEVWKGIPVTDEALTQCIRTLRRVLQDEAAAPRFIQTVPKHGYRFVAQVEPVLATSVAVAARSPSARIAGATTIGALGAGLFGGLFYGTFGTGGGIAGIATLVLLTAALALLGGAGIGTGMGLASLWRGERDWSVVLGGAVGGIVVGALGSALASYGMQSLTGWMPVRVTGMFEGMALGIAASLALVASVRFDLSHGAATSLAAFVGAAIAALTALAGGHFLAMTLTLVEEQFPASHMEMAGVAALFGDEAVQMVTILGTSALEGAVFASAIVLANLAAKRRRA